MVVAILAPRRGRLGQVWGASVSGRDDEVREAVAEAIVDAMRKSGLETGWSEVADAAITVARPFIERAFLEQLIIDAEYAEVWVSAHAEPGGTGDRSPFIADWLRRFREVET